MTLSRREQLVANRMRRGNSITSIDAFQRYQITRLADVIFRLKKKGFKVFTTYHKLTQGTGKYAEYSLFRGTHGT